MRFQIIVLCFICHTLLAGCSMLSAPSLIKSQDYRVNFGDSLWSEINSDQSDQAWQSSKSGSIILANSFCKRYQGSSLKSLSSNLLTGVRILNIIREESLMSHGREAYEIEALTSIDGVDMIIFSRTLRKDFCTYDFVLTSNPSVYSQDRNDFIRFLESVVIK